MRSRFLFLSPPAKRILLACAAMVVSGSTCRADQVPPDVRAGHWATTAVARAIQGGILSPQSDARFHGDAKATRTEVVVALAKLGRALEEGRWKASGRSHAVPESVATIWKTTDWKHEPVRRYTLAVLLVRLGDYVANALSRPAAGAKVGKSEVLEEPQIPAAAKKSPAYESLVYLAHNRMIRSGSVLLKPDDSAVRGDEMSRALAELAAGVVDRVTDLGKNANGETNDESFHQPKKP